MKKLLLTAFVLVTFAVYSFHQRHEGSSLVVRPPASTPPQSTPATSNNSSTSSGSNTSNSPSTTTYKDGQYTGSTADAFYGFVQVEAVISGGKLTDVKFLQYPNDRSTSVAINSQATPYLRQEALQAQSANVNVISGATDTSQAFIQSLSSALNQASS